MNVRTVAPCEVPARAFRGLGAIRPSRLAFGAGRLGAFWQKGGGKEALRALETALDLGINVVDTADVYARGLSERIVGRSIARQRDEVIVCTKLGQVKNPRSAWLAAKLEPQRRNDFVRSAFGKTPSSVDVVPRCFHPEYVRSAVEGSLRRLGTDRLDVLLLHSPSAVEVDRAEYQPVIEEFLAQGKILGFGVSCDNETVAEVALRNPAVSHLELPLDPLTNEFNGVLVEAAARRVVVFSRSPFRGGALARALSVLPSAERSDIAAALLQTVGQRPAVASIVVGMSRPDRVRENLVLLRRHLSNEECLELLNKARVFSKEGAAIC